MSLAPEGEGCPRCGGYVYAAETMLARGRVNQLVLTLTARCQLLPPNFSLVMITIGRCLLLHPVFSSEPFISFQIRFSFGIF